MRTLVAPIVQTMVVVHNTPRREPLSTFDIEGRSDGHVDSGTRFSLTYPAGPSADPAAAVGSAAGAPGAAAPQSSHPALAAEGDPGGA
jgi:hypothetical protein